MNNDNNLYNNNDNPYSNDNKMNNSDNNLNNNHMNNDISNENHMYNNNYNNSSNYQYDTWRVAEDDNRQVYPTPKLSDEPKKKKKGFFKVIRFTAAALIFGIIAGAGASGYHYFFQGGKDRSELVTIQEENSQPDEVAIPLEDNFETDASTISTSTHTQGIITDVSDVVEKVMPSIVTINSTDIITKYDIFFGRQFSEPVQGSGSGIIIGQSESTILVVTNNHVVESAQEIDIVFSDETSAPATIKGADVRSDLAILEINIDDLSKDTLEAIRVASLGDSDELKPGQMVIAIGNALGYGQSVTVGYVSALDREIEIENGIKMNLIQTDAAINPGNSGGALININGEVIGINSLKFASEKVEGMGYAIPISDAIPMINLLMNEQALEVNEMGFLGINVESAQNVTKALSERFNMPVGIFVNDVVEDSPAEAAGLKQGYIITGYNDVSIETVDDLINVLTYSRPGDEITLKVKVLQNGEYIDDQLDVVLSKRP